LFLTICHIVRFNLCDYSLADATYRTYLENIALASSAPSRPIGSAQSEPANAPSASAGPLPAVAGDAYWTASASVRKHLVNLLCGAAFFGDSELIQRLVLEEKVDMQAAGVVTSLRNVADTRGTG
jgi:hypothetical protein